ncbi:MAG: transposase [Actinobacteria bacterium]|nr:transposase [Actinomycetota bacterium]MBU1942663.1 transposase [Actinomycetota bacterium]MBU2685985.1 transposase [Actinomycetota bacterium]
MGRKPREEVPDAIYHLNSKGVFETDIFLDDSDRLLFLRYLSACVKRMKWICHAYCLMTTHYHLLIQAPEANIADGMCYLNGNYARRFNQRHGRTGHLMQERYYPRIIDTEPYLFTVIRYMAQNPLSAGLVREPIDWPWCNCLATAGGQPAPRFLETSFTLALFSNDTVAAQKEYKELIRIPIDPGFDKIPDEHQLPDFEIPGSEQSIDPSCNPSPSLAELFSSCASMEDRNSLVATAFLDHAYKTTEIARFLSISQGRVSQIISQERVAREDSQGS